MSETEWNYLINHTRKAGATVNGVNGIVLLPNNWIGCPSGCSFVEEFANGYNTNTYTSDQWAQMEAQGVVFLPACGFGTADIPIMPNEGISANSIGEIGGYWLSNSWGSCLKISSSGMSFVSLRNLQEDDIPDIPPRHDNVTYNLCVRLVKDI